MSDYSELKRLAEAAIEYAKENDERWPQDDDWFEPELYGIVMDYTKSVSPAAVLAMIAENERHLKLIERMVEQYVPLTELEGAPGWSRVVELVEVATERDKLKAEVECLRAQHGRDSAELRSLCQARDDARKDRDQLKAEVARSTEREIMQLAEIEVLRKDAERWRFFNVVANDLQAFPHSWGLMTKEKMDFMCDEAMDAARKGNEP